MANVLPVLEAIVQGNNNVVLDQAQQKLASMCQQDAVAYMVELAQVLGNEQVQNPYVRQLAATQLKNEIQDDWREGSDAKADRWKTVSREARQVVKEAAMAGLRGPRVVGKGAASVVSAIAVIELPAGEWSDLVTQLKLSVVGAPGQVPSNETKQAALEAIGYMCELLDREDMAEHIGHVLAAVICGMEPMQSEDVRLAACYSLYNSLSFADASFDKTEECDLIFVALLRAIHHDANVQLQAAGYVVLNRVVELHYDKLSRYVQELFEVTMKHMMNEDPNKQPVACQAVEFWSVLAEQESYYLRLAQYHKETNQPAPKVASSNYVHGAMTFLVNNLTALMCRQEDEFLEDGEYNVAVAAGMSLSLCAQTITDPIVQPVMNFVRENISSTDWRRREASILALGAILEGPESNMREIMSSAVPELQPFLGDTVAQCRSTVAWTLGKIAATFPRSIDKQLSSLIEDLARGLRDEYPQVAANCAYALDQVGMAFEGYKDEQTSPLSPFMDGLLTELLNATARNDTDEAHLASNLYDAIMTLVQVCPVDKYSIIEPLVNAMLSRIQQTLAAQVQSTSQREMVMRLQGQCCGVLQIVSTKMGDKIEPLANQIMGAYVTILQQHGETFLVEEVFLAAEAMLMALEEKFLPFYETFKVYMFGGMSNWQQPGLCKVAVACLSQVCTILPDHVVPDLRNVMQCLCSILVEDMAAPELKPPIIQAIGDVAFAVGGDFAPYHQDVSKLLRAAADTELSETDDDFNICVYQVRDCIFEAYSSILNGLGNDSRTDVISQDDLLTIVKLAETCWMNPETTVESKARIFGTISDVALHMPEQMVVQALNRQSIVQMIQTCANPNFPDEDTRFNAETARDALRKLGAQL